MVLLSAVTFGKKRTPLKSAKKFTKSFLTPKNKSSKNLKKRDFCDRIITNMLKNKH